MNKYSVNYSDLNKEISSEKCYRYSEVKHSLVKIAFDVVKFKDSEGIDGLWQVQATDDGEVIVAMYGEEDAPTIKTASAKSPWSTIADNKNKSVHVFYKDEPVTKFAAKELGIDDVDFVSSILPTKLAEDNSFRIAMLNQMASEDKSELLSKFPELGVI